MLSAVCQAAEFSTLLGPMLARSATQLQRKYRHQYFGKQDSFSALNFRLCERQVLQRICAIHTLIEVPEFVHPYTKVNIRCFDQSLAGKQAEICGFSKGIFHASADES